MQAPVNAEIVAVGTEILLGEITDTNSVYLARTLRDIGVNVYFLTSVGDNERRIAEAIRIALRRATIVIVSGGLGPTVDDVTRQGIAAAVGRGLTFHQNLLDRIAERFAGFKMQMTENNRRQAYAPDDAIIVENPVGTAPSFIVEHGEQCVIALPGVPRELKYLMIERIVPYLRERYALSGDIIKARLLKVAGIGESALDELIGDELLNLSNPTVGLAAHSGQIDVRVTAKAGSEADADSMIAMVEARLRERIGVYVFGTDAATIESALIAALGAHGGALAVSETGIDPVISARIRAADGESMLKAIESYTDPAALALALGVEVSTPLRDLAEGAVKTLAQQQGVTVALVVVARPDVVEDQADTNQGSAIAVYVRGKVRSRAYGFGGGSEVAKLWAGTWTMSMAWRMLKEQHEGV
jgi:nicotinamide-nucleotide amidase